MLLFDLAFTPFSTVGSMITHKILSCTIIAVLYLWPHHHPISSKAKSISAPAIRYLFCFGSSFVLERGVTWKRHPGQWRKGEDRQKQPFVFRSNDEWALAAHGGLHFGAGDSFQRSPRLWGKTALERSEVCGALSPLGGMPNCHKGGLWGVVPTRWKEQQKQHEMDTTNCNSHSLPFYATAGEGIAEPCPERRELWGGSDWTVLASRQVLTIMICNRPPLLQVILTNIWLFMSQTHHKRYFQLSLALKC